MKAFANVWSMVVLNGESIRNPVDWDEAITLYVIADFVYAAKNSSYKAVKERWVRLYVEYVELEHRKSIEMIADSEHRVKI